MKSSLHMYACRCLCELSAQNRVKNIIWFERFFFFPTFFFVSRRKKWTSRIHSIYFKRTLQFCLFGAVAPTSAACLCYPIGVYAYCRCCCCCCCVLLVQFFLFSLFSRFVNALFSVDVSVGVVVTCNLRTFFCVPTSFVRLIHFVTNVHMQPKVKKTDRNQKHIEERRKREEEGDQEPATQEQNEYRRNEIMYKEFCSKKDLKYPYTSRSHTHTHMCAQNSTRSSA